MRTPTLVLAFLTVSLAAGRIGAVELETDAQKTVYTLGVALARNLTGFDLDENEIEYLVAGISDKLAGRPPRVELAQYMSRLDGFARERRERMAAGEKEAAKAFLSRAEGEPGATKTESGLVFREVEAGTGAIPTPNDMVQVHYHGTLHDGTVFDSSRERGQPARFRVQGVISCWTEALQLMKVGGKAVITCPAEIAYGDRGAGEKILPGAALRFEVELLGIETPPGG